MTARGDRVARGPQGGQHIARIIQADGVVMALCGNTVVRPRRVAPVPWRVCPTCAAIERKTEWC